MKQINVITIDGPSASGKGALARKIANKFSLNILDSGILYRLFAYFDNLSIPHSEIAKRIKQEMRRYEAIRKPRTTLIGAKAGILGYLETLGGEDSGMKFRNNLFSILGKLGVVDAVFKDGATPQM